MLNLVLDTNLLVLYFLGLYRKDYIEKCTLTRNYTKEDFKLLESILKEFRKIYITPQILAEFSNLLLNSNLKDPGLTEYFKLVVSKLSGVDSIKEEYIAMSTLVLNEGMLASFGFTDISIYEVLKKDRFYVLTDDSPFYKYISSKHLHGIYFTMIRGQAWGISNIRSLVLAN